MREKDMVVRDLEGNIRKLIKVHNGMIDALLRILYFAEFEVIDKLNQHPSGLSFDNWCFEKRRTWAKEDKT